MTADTPQIITDELTRYATNWVEAAIGLYAFDQETAQRLAFIRWLRATGRLRGDDSAAPESTPLRRWTGW